jgi:hypothetical protein
MATTAHVVDTVVSLPRSAAKISANLLVLEAYPYLQASDIRYGQKPFFGVEPDIFPQAWRPAASVFLDNTFLYNAAVDAPRITQQKVFSEPEVFAQAQRAALVVLSAPYPGVPQNLRTTTPVQIETTVSFHGQRGSLLVLAQQAPPPVPIDIFNGNDAFYGWPLETFEPPIFPQTWKGAFVVTNGFPAYNPAPDRRARQAVFFAETETFLAPWKTNVTILNGTAGYVAANDFRKTTGTTKIFPEPEVFLQPWRFSSVILNGFAPYNPATDVTQLKQPLKLILEPEVFAQAQRPARVVWDVQAPAPAYVPQSISIIAMRVRPGGYIRMNIRPNQSYPL